MKRFTIILMTLLLLCGTAAECSVPEEIPTLEVGEMRDERQSVPLAGAESATVEIRLGVGKLEIRGGVSDTLFSGRFRYNVEHWAPEVTYVDDLLTIRQGGAKKDWGIPTGLTHNQWQLELSPEIPLEMQVRVGAGDGELDFSGLQLTALDVDVGAGDFVVRFDVPNQARMDHLTLDAGASKLETMRVGNASPERVEVRGGVGDITLDFAGAWSGSAEMKITAGVGSLTLRLPDDVGVRVETRSGLSKVKASGLKRVAGAYVNDAFGEAETELRIRLTTGIGSVHLIGVPNDE